MTIPVGGDDPVGKFKPCMKYKFESCTLDVERRELHCDGILRSVEPQVFDLLHFLIKNRNRVVSRENIFDAVWHGRIVSDAVLGTRINAARRAIGDDGTQQRLIKTLPRNGFRFIGAVSEAKVDGHLVEARDVLAPLAERRQVTVLSCQILGFASLSAKMDPEDLEDSINHVYGACGAVVLRFGGTMVRTLGDGVVAYFGYPKAQEDDAERGVRAALELLCVIATVRAAPIVNFRARIGIATGPMIVSESAAEGQRPGMMGKALNLALHLQKAAPADAVVIAASTRTLIGRFFECHEIKPVEMEEGCEPAPAWRVTGAIPGMPRFDALRLEGMPDLVGREEEINRLQHCWSKARRGSGQVVLLMGEAGVGKSRLTIELQERLRDEPHAMIRWFGSPHRNDAPMSIIIEELQRSAGFAADEDAARKVDKLRRHFAILGAVAEEAMTLVSGLLGLPYDAPANISHLSPQRRKERTLAAVLALVDAMAARQSVLAVVDDVQWADATSLEFLTLLVERANAMRLLLVIIGRPEFTPSWPEHSHVTTLVLPRLSRSEAVALVRQVADGRRIPLGIEVDIAAQADGVPLFVEELTKSILQNTAIGDNSLALRSPVAATMPIPPTLHSLLLMRLDRLEGGKEAAQAGAVIGREFSFELLRAIVGLDQQALTRSLDQLVASGLVFKHGLPPEASFVFKHALVRDAAYSMLLRARRQKLHANLARAYEEHLPETAQVKPELLAYHWRHGADATKAIRYLLTAAERALYRSATTEALSHLAQARELIANLLANAERLKLELQLEVTLARTLLAAKGYTAAETREAYRCARERCESLDDQSSLPLIIHGQWLGAWLAADHYSALKRAGELQAWGERNQDQVGFAMAHSDFGMTLTSLGRLPEARQHLDRALRINRFVLRGQQPFVASEVDGRISTLSFMHNCLLLLGFPNQAEAVAREAAALDPENLYSKLLAQTRLLRMGVFARDAHTVGKRGPPLIRLAEEQGYPFFVATLMIYTGWALAQLGDSHCGIASCERGLAQLDSIGSRCWLPLSLALLAECHERAGNPDSAVEVIARALASVDATDERLWEAEIYRLRGRLFAASGDSETAETCFMTALKKAQQQQAKLLEIRAATSLAQLFKSVHEPMRARDVLAPIYNSFAEGFEFIDLREAKALLDILSDR